MKVIQPLPTSTHRLLVIDDDSVSRMLISEILRHQEFEVIVAEDAAGARAIIERDGTNSFDALITDYSMPGENGLSLLAWVKGRDATLATILVTANGERRLVTDSLHCGIHDFHEKPIAASRLLPSVARAVGVTLRQRRMREAETAVRDVARLQHALVRMQSQGADDRVDICYVPKQQAGGDFVSIFRQGPGEFIVLATDVSGHDLRAAFAASYIQGIARGMIELRAPIDEVFQFFNRFLVTEWNRPRHWEGCSVVDTSLASCAIQVNLNRQSVRVLNCGFPVPLLTGNLCQARPLVEGGSSPLGWFDQAEPASATVDVAGQARITLWSDGLEDLAVAMGVDPHAIAFVVHESRRTGDSPPSFLAEARDDVMSVQIDLSAQAGNGEKSSWVLVRQSYAGNTESQLDDFQRLWSDSLHLARPELDETRLFAILLCAREALLNALCHGCEGRPELSAEVTIALEPATETLLLRVRDPGPGHTFHADEDASTPAANLPIRQRGLTLIHHFCDEFTSGAQGADLTMHFRRASSIPSLSQP